MDESIKSVGGRAERVGLGIGVAYPAALLGVTQQGRSESAAGAELGPVGDGVGETVRNTPGFFGLVDKGRWANAEAGVVAAARLADHDDGVVAVTLPRDLGVEVAAQHAESGTEYAAGNPIGHVGQVGG